MSKTGKVYLIGAGPGDKGLITVKGKELLGSSDVIIYDYLVNTDLLEYAASGAEIIYVGKKAGKKEMSQSEINSLLIKNAKSGKIVARLKGGDPFTFGRGGEEAQVLVTKKIPFEIVPGVSSVSAVPAYAGISLTHRDFTSSFAVVTGHEDPSKEKSFIAWDALSKMGTVVFLMVVKNLRKNMKELMLAGKDARTPVAVVSWGTYPTQTTLTGTIKNIADLAKERKDISSPGVVVVGDVVKLREIINWYETKPLFGRNILVTRPKEQSYDFINMLESQGANVIAFPTIEISAPRSYQTLDKAIYRIERYDWIIFTSVNGVKSFINRLKHQNIDIRALNRAKIASIGEVTAHELENMGIIVDVIPDDYKAEGLIKVFKKMKVAGLNVLIPRAEVARDILPETLTKLGANVDLVVAYQTKKPKKTKTTFIQKLIDDNKIDLISFTSSSTARNFFEIIPEFKQSSKGPIIATIGPITAKTVREFGYKVKIMPKDYTAAKLAEGIIEFYKRKT